MKVSNSIYNQLLSKNTTDLIQDLYAKAPVFIYTNNLPEKLFAAAQKSDRKAKKDKKKKEGSFIKKFISWLTEKSPEELEKEAIYILSKAGKFKKTPNNTPKEDREKNFKKYNEMISKADSLLLEAYKKAEYDLNFALKTADRYFNNDDFKKSRVWLVHSGKSPEYNADILINMLKTNNFKKIWNVIESMGYLKDRAYSAPLTELLDSTDSIEIKCFCIESLGKLGDRKNIEVLSRYYTNDIWGIRLLAGQALEQLTGNKYPVEMPADSQVN